MLYICCYEIMRADVSVLHVGRFNNDQFTLLHILTWIWWPHCKVLSPHTHCPQELLSHVRDLTGMANNTATMPVIFMTGASG